MKYKKVFEVIIADGLQLFVGLISAFFFPKVFTIDQYYFYKTYGLYITYAGIFQLGFSDGIYLLLGGKKEKDIDMRKVRGYFNALLKIDSLVFMVLLCFLILFASKDKAVGYFILYVLPFQIVHYFRLYYRAIGEFNKYSFFQGTISIFNLTNTLVTAIVLKSPEVFMVLQILSFSIVAAISAINFIKKHPTSISVELNEILYICKIGAIVMLSNTICSLFFSLDRWFVKYLFTVKEFAYYSFATSMLRVFISLISSITIVYYPYIVRNVDDYKNIGKLKTYSIIISAFAPSGFFILNFIVKKYLNTYVISLDILKILILSVPFMAMTNSIYSNLYKAKKQVRKYLKVVSIMLLFALVLNLVLFWIFKSVEIIAVSTLISFIASYIYSSTHFKGGEIKIKEIVFFALFFLTFLILDSLNLGEGISFVIYVLIMMINVGICFNKEVREIVKGLKT